MIESRVFFYFATKLNFTDSIKMGTNVKRKALVLSSFSSTKSPARFTLLWDNLKPLRSVPTISVCYFLSFLLFGIVFYYYYFLNFLLFLLLWKSDLCENFCSATDDDGAGTRRQREIVCVARYRFCRWWIEGRALLH